MARKKPKEHKRRIFTKSGWKEILVNKGEREKEEKKNKAIKIAAALGGVGLLGASLYAMRKRKGKIPTKPTTLKQVLEKKQKPKGIPKVNKVVEETPKNIVKKTENVVKETPKVKQVKGETPKPEKVEPKFPTVPDPWEGDVKIVNPQKIKKVQEPQKLLPPSTSPAKNIVTKSRKQLFKDTVKQWEDEWDKLPEGMQQVATLNIVTDVIMNKPTVSPLRPGKVPTKALKDKIGWGHRDDIANELAKRMEKGGYSKLEADEFSQRMINKMFKRDDPIVLPDMKKRAALGIDAASKAMDTVVNAEKAIVKDIAEELPTLKKNYKELQKSLDDAVIEIEKRTRRKRYKVATDEEWRQHLFGKGIKDNAKVELAIAKRKALGIVSPEMEKVLGDVKKQQSIQGSVNFLKTLLEDLDEVGDQIVSKRNFMKLFGRKVAEETLTKGRLTKARLQRLNNNLQNIGKYTNKKKFLQDYQKTTKGGRYKTDLFALGDNYREANKLYEQLNPLNDQGLVERGINRIVKLFAKSKVGI